MKTIEVKRPRPEDLVTMAVISPDCSVRVYKSYDPETTETPQLWEVNLDKLEIPGHETSTFISYCDALEYLKKAHQAYTWKESKNLGFPIELTFKLRTYILIK